MFTLEPLPETHKQIDITEIRREEKNFGVKSKEIIHKEVVATVNGVVVYFELIEDDKVVQRFVNFRDPTIIHNVRDQMILNVEYPMIIAALNDMVSLVDLNLQEALNRGALDECSYSFMYRKLKGGVLKGCTDKLNNQQDFMANSRFDPFDDVNQVELSEPEQLLIPSSKIGILDSKSMNQILQTPEPEAVLNLYQQGFIASTKPFMMGFVFPAYLFSLFGLFKGI